MCVSLYWRFPFLVLSSLSWFLSTILFYYRAVHQRIIYATNQSLHALITPKRCVDIVWRQPQWFWWLISNRQSSMAIHSVDEALFVNVRNTKNSSGANCGMYAKNRAAKANPIPIWWALTSWWRGVASSTRKAWSFTYIYIYLCYKLRCLADRRNKESMENWRMWCV